MSNQPVLVIVFFFTILPSVLGLCFTKAIAQDCNFAVNKIDDKGQVIEQRFDVPITNEQFETVVLTVERKVETFKLITKSIQAFPSFESFTTHSIRKDDHPGVILLDDGTLVKLACINNSYNSYYQNNEFTGEKENYLEVEYLLLQKDVTLLQSRQIEELILKTSGVRNDGSVNHNIYVQFNKEQSENTLRLFKCIMADLNLREQELNDDREANALKESLGSTENDLVSESSASIDPANGLRLGDYDYRDELHYVSGYVSRGVIIKEDGGWITFMVADGESYRVNLSNGIEKVVRNTELEQVQSLTANSQEQDLENPDFSYSTMTRKEKWRAHKQENKGGVHFAMIGGYRLSQSIGWTTRINFGGMFTNAVGMELMTGYSDGNTLDYGLSFMVTPSVIRVRPVIKLGMGHETNLSKAADFTTNYKVMFSHGFDFKLAKYFGFFIAVDLEYRLGQQLALFGNSQVVYGGLRFARW